MFVDRGLCQATCHDLSLHQIAVLVLVFEGLPNFFGPVCRLPVAVVNIFQTFFEASLVRHLGCVFVQVLVGRRLMG